VQPASTACRWVHPSPLSASDVSRTANARNGNLLEVKWMNDKLMQFRLNPPEIDHESPIMSIVEKIRVDTINMMDDAIVQACINAAKAEGISNLVLLDRKFVTDAIREKIAREHTGRWLDEHTDIKCSECGATFSDEIAFMRRDAYGYEYPEHCPACGVRMEGDTDDDSGQ
jgi:hypothetical protein